MKRVTRIDGPEEDPSALDPQSLDDGGLSLEELGQTYARLMGQGELPYGQTEEEAEDSVESTEYDPISEEAVESDDCPITPLSILEAVMFVGHPNNEPITAEQIASLMRGVRPAEIDQLVCELNERYRQRNQCMEIVGAAGGYRMQLCEDLHPVRNRMYGKIKETRLNQAAIDCLALVAYQPGITRKQVEEQWKHSAGSVLSMLIRRNLLELKRDSGDTKSESRYYPTQRMLNLFGLASLDELPVVEDEDPL